MKLLKEADKNALYEQALYNVAVLAEDADKITYTKDRVYAASTTPGSVADLGIDWSRVSQSATLDFSWAHLTSCEGFKNSEVYNGSIILSRNQFSNLKGLPKKIYGELWLDDNKNLQSLEGAPIQCDRLSLAGCEKLTNFEHCPEAVDNINADHCVAIASLKGLPKRMKMFLLYTKEAVAFDCDVMQCFDLTIESKNTSLKGLDAAFKGASQISFGRTPIKSNVLGLLRIDGLKSVHTYSTDADLVKAFEIINKHLPSTGSMKAILECQDELIEAGLDDFAKL